MAKPALTAAELGCGKPKISDSEGAVCNGDEVGEDDDVIEDGGGATGESDDVLLKVPLPEPILGEPFVFEFDLFAEDDETDLCFNNLDLSISPIIGDLLEEILALTDLKFELDDLLDNPNLFLKFFFESLITSGDKDDKFSFLFDSVVLGVVTFDDAAAVLAVVAVGVDIVEFDSVVFFDLTGTLDNCLAVSLAVTLFGFELLIFGVIITELEVPLVLTDPLSELLLLPLPFELKKDEFCSEVLLSNGENCNDDLLLVIYSLLFNFGDSIFNFDSIILEIDSADEGIVGVVVVAIGLMVIPLLPFKDLFVVVAVDVVVGDGVDDDDDDDKADAEEAANEAAVFEFFDFNSDSNRLLFFSINLLFNIFLINFGLFEAFNIWFFNTEDGIDDVLLVNFPFGST